MPPNFGLQIASPTNHDRVLSILEMTMVHSHKQDLAKLIYSMPYGELMAVASELSAMKGPDVRPKIKTPQEFADVLYDWAESTASDGGQ